MSDERDWIVVVIADREVLSGEAVSESYQELIDANPDADLTVHVATPIHYGPFTEAEARAHAGQVEGGAHRLIRPIVEPVAAKEVPMDAIELGGYAKGWPVLRAERDRYRQVLAEIASTPPLEETGAASVRNRIIAAARSVLATQEEET